MKPYLAFLRASVLAVVLALPVAAMAQSATATPSARPPGRGWRQAQRPVFRAIRHLEMSKRFLEDDKSPDPAGHRADALKAIDDALGHLRAAEQVQTK